MLESAWNWQPRPATSTASGLLSYLRTTYADETATAREFLRRVRQRVAERPSRTDRMFIAVLRDGVGQRFLYWTGELGLLCRTFATIAPTSDLFLTVPSLTPGGRGIHDRLGA